MNRRLLALGAIAVGIGLGVLIASVSGLSPVPNLDEWLIKNRVAVGKKAPDFKLLSLTNEEVKLSGYKGSLVIVNFWATWCEPCKAEMPHFQKIHDQFEPRINVIGVNMAEPADLIKQFAEEYSISIELLLDTDGEVARLYQVHGVPTTYIISDTGRIIIQHIGYLSEERLDHYLDEIES